MEQVLTKAKPISAYIVKQVVIATSIASLYWGICMLNPAMATFYFNGLTNIRFANALRAFVLVSPAAIVGTGFGAHFFNVSIGRAAIGAFPLVPFIIMFIGLGLHFILQKIGRSLVKDILFLALYGFLTSLIVTLHMTTFAILFDGSTWGKLMQSAVQMKLLTGTLVVLAGYPIVLFFEKKQLDSRLHKWVSKKLKTEE